MSLPLTDESQFVVELLTTLRAEKFSPAAWVRFLARSWAMSCKTANAHPSLKRSWKRVSLLLALLALAVLTTSFVVEGLGVAVRLLPGFLLCIAWQISDLFWHLGLHRSPQSGALLPTVGMATLFTQMRGLAASFLLGRLVGGVPTPTGLLLLVFLCGIVTDILDGRIARHTGMQSKLGQLADGETDFCLYLAVTVILVLNGNLPFWPGALMLARFVLPLLAAVISYFVFAQPVRFGSTIWGKCAGLAQCLYFLAVLAPPQLATITRLLNLPLLLITLALLIAAPTAQIIANVRVRSG